MRRSYSMRRTVVGRLAESLYKFPVLGPAVLAFAVRREGGDMTSVTLRRVLARFHGVEVGPYSYGALLRPGAADRGTSIGSYVSIGPGVRRFGANHPTRRLIMHPYAYNPALGLVGADFDVRRTECRIEHDAWIGANVVITRSCQRIGIGAVVGAGAILTEDVDDFTVVAGNPARVIASRLSESEQALVRSMDFISLDPRELVEFVTRSRESGLRHTGADAEPDLR